MPVNKVAVVDKKMCTGCGLCEDTCLEEAISVEDIAEVDSGKCTGCGNCVEDCPNEAISLE